MSKKFSIVKEIDLDKLRKQIELYVCETGETNPYIFMNKETIDELISQVRYKPDRLWGVQSGSMCGYFQGHKVFCDNMLSFGEVEIR